MVTRNVRQLGITLPFYQSHGVASKDFIKMIGEAGEGIRMPASALAVVDQLPAADPQKPVVLAFRKAYADAYKADASTFAGYAWDGLHMVVEAAKRAGGADKAKLRDELEKTKGFVGTTGVFTMTATDHMGLDQSSFHLVEIKGGDWKLLD